MLKTLSGTKHFLHFLELPVTARALTDLVEKTRRQHRKENYATDDKLLEFVGQLQYVAVGAVAVVVVVGLIAVFLRRRTKAK